LKVVYLNVAKNLIASSDLHSAIWLTMERVNM